MQFESPSLLSALHIDERDWESGNEATQEVLNLFRQLHGLEGCGVPRASTASICDCKLSERAAAPTYVPRVANLVL